MNTKFAVWVESEHAEAYSLDYVGCLTDAKTVLAYEERKAVLLRASQPVVALYAEAEAEAYTWRQNAIARWCAWGNAYAVETRKFHWVDLAGAADGLVECASLEAAHGLLAEAVFVPRHYVGYGYRSAM